jgi:hypothetical protein
MTTPEPEPELGDEDWWYDMRIAYNFDLIDPAPGTPEAEAFRQMGEYSRSEFKRVAEQDRRDAEYARRKAAREAEPEAGQ